MFSCWFKRNKIKLSNQFERGHNFKRVCKKIVENRKMQSKSTLQTTFVRFFAENEIEMNENLI